MKIMSENLSKNKNFLLLLLNTSKKQMYALLDSVDKNQSLALSEIFANLLHLPLSKDAHRLLKVHRRLVERLSSKKTSYSKKSSLLRRHRNAVRHLLFAIKENLELKIKE